MPKGMEKGLYGQISGDVKEGDKEEGVISGGVKERDKEEGIISGGVKEWDKRRKRNGHIRLGPL